ncbi:hypothetical protein GWI33_016719 [Rhynchophorus ferrugineus]|uniref:Uncharacterized protein n=1 Tax=Rhynchophorus ferrugineus TaxID=354439 RepID=A0A834HXI8_RHYFE|nr:hypothetical protein GWI33_016719 [Rhynchophorus ferrugineus]
MNQIGRNDVLNHPSDEERLFPLRQMMELTWSPEGVDSDVPGRKNDNLTPRSYKRNIVRSPRPSPPSIHRLNEIKFRLRFRPIKSQSVI